MKTAINIPDALFDSVEQFAQKRGISLDELYADALSRYLKQRDDDAITEQLNRVYSAHSNSLDPVMAEIQVRSLPKDAW